MAERNLADTLLALTKRWLKKNRPDLLVQR